MKKFLANFLEKMAYAILLIIMIVLTIATYIFAYVHHWLWFFPAVVDTALLVNIFLKLEE